MRGDGEKELGNYFGERIKEKNDEKQVLGNGVAVGELQLEIFDVARIHEKR